MSSVTLEAISKRFSGAAAVDTLSLTIRSGEFVTLLGPSGCGKTTTLRLLAGLMLPDEGMIRIGDADVTHQPGHKRNIGMVFQSHALFPHMTITDNIGFGLRMRGVPAAQRRVQAERALEQVQLGGFGNRMPKQLSGGQQQRVALARAIVFDPAILLLDEPFAALDRKLRETLQIELRELTRRIGITAVFVTHDQEEALTLSDRIAVMNKGRIEQIGSPAELFEQPATRFVADFMGFGNIFDGVVQGLTDEVIVIEVSGVELTAPRVPGVMIGQAIGFGLRAERITLERAETAADGQYTGLVTAALYQGTVATYRVRLDQMAARELLVREPTRADGHLRFALGDRAKVSWPADAVRILLR